MSTQNSGRRALARENFSIAGGIVAAAGKMPFYRASAPVGKVRITLNERKGFPSSRAARAPALRRVVDKRGSPSANRSKNRSKNPLWRSDYFTDVDV
ncbi:MAG: hypothetical protein WBD40_20405 [Tepidisphaeraceae bacterium]